MLSRFKIEASPKAQSDMVIVQESVMREVTESLLQAVGMEAEGAQTVADVLIANDLRGNDSHGVSNMLRKYTEWFLEGKQNPR